MWEKERVLHILWSAEWMTRHNTKKLDLSNGFNRHMRQVNLFSEVDPTAELTVNIQKMP
jgi:hypothetical protein